jgi:hypothetical protein
MILFVLMLGLWLVVPVWGLGLSQTPTDMEVTYTEPVTDALGQPLTDLKETIIEVQEGGVLLFTVQKPASALTGGGAIVEIIPVNVAVGEDRTFDVSVVAKDLVGNMSTPVTQAITFDRLAPGPVTD